MTEPLQWVLFTCEARTGKLVSGQYIVKDGVVIVPSTNLVTAILQQETPPFLPKRVGGAHGALFSPRPASCRPALWRRSAP